MEFWVAKIQSIRMRVCEALISLTDYFKKKSIDSPKTDAELLLSFVLKCKRLELFLNYEKELTESQTNLLRDYSIRRAHREPLQYIIGDVDFYGQHIKVDHRVLIPRSETEELVYQIQQYWQGNVPRKGLELGVGSGAISIALVALNLKLQMVAVDISEEALSLAYDNAVDNRVNDRIQFVHSSWFEKVQGCFDFIVSNPPYLTQKEYEEAQDEVRLFEPYGALVAKDNGLKDLKTILKQGIDYLSQDGFIVLETGINQHETLKAYAEQCGYAMTKSTLDLQKRKRYFWAWRKQL